MMLKLKNRKGIYNALGIVGLLLFLVSVSSPSFTNAQKKIPSKKQSQSKVPAMARRAGDSPEELFARGSFYLNNNDITDKAADEFKLLIRKHPNSPEAAKSQFYLGSYYHRKHNIISYRTSSMVGLDDLYKAKEAYETYINRYPQDSRCECLADAYFHLSVVLKQLGYPSPTGHALAKMRDISHIDSKVYIYQVVWSSSSKDVIDAHLDTKRLAEFAYPLSGRDYALYLTLLKAWCRSEKSKG